MNILARLRSLFRSHSSAGTLKDPARFLIDFFSGRETLSGVNVTEENATQSIAVFAAIKIIAEDVASLPFITYRRLPNGGKERATDHPLFKILHHQPNPEMTAMQLRETIQAHVLLRGNSFAEIVHDNAGRVTQLWPLSPRRIRRRRINGELTYEFRPKTGAPRLLAKEIVLDLRGLSWNGIDGLSPIGEAREGIGLTIATERFGSAFFGNRADPGGILEHPAQLSDKAYERLKKSWNERHRGLSNSQRMTILEEGMKWERIGVPPEDAQFLQTRKFQVNEIARLYRIPPNKLGDLERSTFSNVEQQAIDYVVDTLRPWLVRWEQEVLVKLFSEEERETFFAEHLIEGLLRGDTETRNKGYAVGRQWGWLSADDVRERENLNPLPDRQGKIYMVPLNMIPASNLAPGAPIDAPEPAPTDADITDEPRAQHPPCPEGQHLVDGVCKEMSAAEKEAAKKKKKRSAAAPKELRAASHRRRIARSFEPIFKATAARVLRREKTDVMRQAKKLLGARDAQQFENFLESFYDKHQAFVKREFDPAIESLTDAIAPVAATEVGQQPISLADITPIRTGYSDAMASRHVTSSRGQLTQVVRKAVAEKRDPIKALEDRIAEWEDRRPTKIAKRETVQEGNFVTRAVWRQIGIRTIRWITFGENCPYCDSLNGRAVAIDKTFMSQGEGLLPAGTTQTLTVFTNIGHPPLHQACDCGIVPA